MHVEFHLKCSFSTVLCSPSQHLLLGSKLQGLFCIAPYPSPHKDFFQASGGVMCQGPQGGGGNFDLLYHPTGGAICIKNTKVVVTWLLVREVSSAYILR